MLSEEGVADDGRWILVVGGTDVFGDGLVLGECEDGAGWGLVEVLVQSRSVGRAWWRRGERGERNGGRRRGRGRG